LETALYLPVKRFLEKLGFTVKGEVGGCDVVALSGSRRTESMWVRTTVFATDEKPVATMLLNLASMKDSYANYEREYKALYG